MFTFSHHTIQKNKQSSWQQPHITHAKSWHNATCHISYILLCWLSSKKKDSDKANQSKPKHPTMTNTNSNKRDKCLFRLIPAHFNLLSCVDWFKQTVNNLLACSFIFHACCPLFWTEGKATPFCNSLFFLFSSLIFLWSTVESAKRILSLFSKVRSPRMARSSSPPCIASNTSCAWSSSRDQFRFCFV